MQGDIPSKVMCIFMSILNSARTKITIFHIGSEPKTSEGVSLLGEYFLFKVTTNPSDFHV